METLAPGKFKVTIAGEAREVIVSFGIRSEILRMITKKQLEYRKLSSKEMMPAALRADLTKNVEALDALRVTKAQRPTEGLSEEDAKKFLSEDNQIEELQSKVNALYLESIDQIDRNRDQITEIMTTGMIDMTDTAVAEILVIALMKRDETGKVTEFITTEQVLYGKDYVESADELLNLIEGIMEYLTLALKKVSAVSQMVGSLVRPD